MVVLFVGLKWPLAFEIVAAHFLKEEKKSLLPDLSGAEKHGSQRDRLLVFFANRMACSILSPHNLKSAVFTDSWLKMAPAPRRRQQQHQHQEEPQPWHPHPPPPLPMPPTTTSMSPKSDDLVASAPPLSPFPPPWRWELATCTVPLHRHAHLLFLS